MKVLGLIKEFEETNDFAKPLAEYLTNETMSEKVQISVLKYLQSGTLCAGVMNWLFDVEVENEDLSIGPNAYYTDGKWIWAEYLPYYLKKYPNFKLDQDFLSDVQRQKYQMPVLSEEQEREAEQYFHKNIF